MTRNCSMRRPTLLAATEVPLGFEVEGERSKGEARREASQPDSAIGVLFSYLLPKRSSFNLTEDSICGEMCSALSPKFDAQIWIGRRTSFLGSWTCLVTSTYLFC